MVTHRYLAALIVGILNEHTQFLIEPRILTASCPTLHLAPCLAQTSRLAADVEMASNRNGLIQISTSFERGRRIGIGTNCRRIVVV